MDVGWPHKAAVQGTVLSHFLLLSGVKRRRAEPSGQQGRLQPRRSSSSSAVTAPGCQDSTRGSHREAPEQLSRSSAPVLAVGKNSRRSPGQGILSDCAAAVFLCSASSALSIPFRNCE